MDYSQIHRFLEVFGQPLTSAPSEQGCSCVFVPMSFDSLKSLALVGSRSAEKRMKSGGIPYPCDCTASRVQTSLNIVTASGQILCE